MHDIAANVVKYKKEGILGTDADVLKAGEDYGFWIRDAAINSWNGAGLLLPEVNHASMLPFLVKTPGGYSFNKNDQLWDAIIWIVGAWWHYLYTLDRKFLKFALRVGRDLMKHYEGKWQDKKSGLFVGGAVTADASAGYPDELVQGIKETNGAKDWADWRRIRNDPQLVNFKTLSTNCIYYHAYLILGQMEKLLRTASGQPWLAKARRLKTAINRHFWDSRHGHYQYVISDRHRFNYQDAMGHSFALLFDIPDQVRAASVFAHQHVTRFGAPVNWPSFKRFKALGKHNHFGHINCLVWPEVNGFWAHAAAKHRQYRLFEFELLNLAKLAVRDGQFVEIFHPLTGKPYGGLADYPMTPDHPRFKGTNYFMWQVCGKQVWCATAFFRMITMGLLGMDFTPDGVRFSPHLPAWLKIISMTKLRYADMTLSIRVEGRGNEIRQFTCSDRQVRNNFISNTLKGEQKVLIVMG